jgi:ABC-2 type transport system ATP-binding protein
MATSSHDHQQLVQVDRLSRLYGDTLAVNQVSFELKRGEVLGFLGPNGAGKSTSMQMITGNLAPTAGQITINGFDLIDQPIEAKSCIGYLPENPPVYRELTVIEYLSYCARLHRIPSSRLRSALDDAMLHCGLEQVAKRLIGNLSKGFQQRVGIAQAIIHQPPVVILDEPTVGLDPIQIREIRKLIKALGKDRSVILSTHILPEVQFICDRVQIIRRGELIYHATIDELSQRGQGNSLTVAFRHAPAEDRLLQLSGLQHLAALDEHRFQIQFEQDDFAEQLVLKSVENNWGLFELIPDNTSLEQIFVELTTDEHPDLHTDTEHAA